MKKILLTFVLFLLIAGATYLVQGYLKEGKTLSFFKKTSVVTIANHNFKVSVAASQKEREIGLSEAKSLSENQGMIFLFEKPDYYSFWMKNMKFPIDIIYINQDTIVTIKNSVPSPKNSSEILPVYNSTGPSNKVLEIQAGLSKKYNFKNGDKVKYENLSN
jgi:uncharacterized protein